MRDVVEIGLGKTAQRGYHLDDVAIVPVPAHPRRRRRLDRLADRRLPVRHPAAWPPVGRRREPGHGGRGSARLGGLGVLNGEGLWTRYEDPTQVLDELRRGWTSDGAAPPGGCRRSTPSRSSRT